MAETNSVESNYEPQNINDYHMHYVYSPHSKTTILHRALHQYDMCLIRSLRMLFVNLKLLMVVMYLPLAFGSSWGITQKIIAPDYYRYDYFGFSVSVYDTFLMIGSYLDDDKGTNSGSVYTYRRENGTWIKTVKLLAGDGSAFDLFGKSASLHGNYVAIGAKDSVYIFERDPNYDIWMQSTKLIASDNFTGNLFGCAVSVYGNYALVGASAAHAAYVFERDPLSTTWSQSVKLNSSDGFLGDLGFSVAIYGNYTLIGAPTDNEKGTSAGSAYIFEYSSDIDPLNQKWTEKTRLLASDGAASDQFGFSVAMYDTYAVIGAPYTHSGIGSNAGSVYIFERESVRNIWIQKAKLVANDGAYNDNFGYSISISHNIIAIGAKGDGYSAGSVYIYERDTRSNIWIQMTKLVASDASSDDRFGHSISISDQYVVTGAIGVDRYHWDSSYRYYDRGAVYIAQLSTDSPTEFPTPEPTNNPTKYPTQYPTKEPTEDPTTDPTIRPTGGPSRFPTITTLSPTFIPTSFPTEIPTKSPTKSSMNPTIKPTGRPSEATFSPSRYPTALTPTGSPTPSPTDRPTSPTNAPSLAPTEIFQFDANIHWSALDGVFCSNLEQKIKSIDDINEIECKIQCIDNKICDTVTYFHLIDKTQQSRCYLFHDRCNGYSFTKKLADDVTTYLLHKSTVYNILSNCIDYPYDWKDILSESCHSYHNSYCRNNSIIDGELDDIMSYKDDVYHYSAKDVCCTCGAGVYESDDVLLYPYTTTTPPIDICSADWSAFMQNMTAMHGALLPKLREWNASHVLHLCEVFLFKMQHQYEGYGSLNKTTCYSVIYNGSITICSNRSNMNAVFMFDAMRNAFYINDKWINTSNLEQFDNIGYSDSCEDYIGDYNDVIMKVTPCELLQNISSLFPHKVPFGGKKPSDLTWIVVGSVLGFVAIVCIVVSVILLSKGYKLSILRWKSKSNSSFVQAKEGEVDPINIAYQPGAPRVRVTYE